MNDEASSSSAAAGAQQHRNHDHGDTSHEAAPTPAELAERRKKNRVMFNRKRGDLLDDLLKNLDILVYAELSVIYYMDCSFLRFLFRLFVQFTFLSPKPLPLPEHPPDKPVIGAIVGSNILCCLLHLWLSPVAAGEATRGYLHGGLAMDFIGQKGPTSKMHLFLLDILLVLLQLTHMAGNMTKQRLKEASTTSTSTSTTASAQETPASARQDLDSEERGVHRSEEQQDIEMQNLNPSSTESNSTTSNSTTDPTSPPHPPDAAILSAFHSGQIVVADLDLWKRIKDQIQLVKNYRADAQASSSSSVQNIRAELAQRMLRMRDGTDAMRQTL